MWEDHLLHRCNNSTKIYYCPEKVPKIVHEPPTERHSGKKKTNNGPLLKERPNVMKYIDFVFFLKEVECLHPKGAKNLISFLITRFYEMLIAFRLLTNGEDYQMYGNIDIYNAAPNIFIFY